MVKNDWNRAAVLRLQLAAQLFDLFPDDLDVALLVLIRSHPDVVRLVELAVQIREDYEFRGTSTYDDLGVAITKLQSESVEEK